jgi:hypothetical protein
MKSLDFIKQLWSAFTHQSKRDPQAHAKISNFETKNYASIALFDVGAAFGLARVLWHHMAGS